MIEMITEYALEAVLLLVLIFAYTLTVGTLLPRWLLKLEYIPGAPTDRGLRKYVFPEGRGISYEPHPSVRKYVKQYILFVKDGSKYIKCKVADSVGFFGYAAVVFNNQNKVIDVVRVNETVSQDGTTRSVSLPKETSYIGFVLYSVNGKRVLENAPFEYHAGKKRAFIALVSLLSGAVALGLRGVITRVFTVLGEYIDLVDIEINPILTLTVGVLAGAMCATHTVRANRRRMVD